MLTFKKIFFKIPPHKITFLWTLKLLLLNFNTILTIFTDVYYPNLIAECLGGNCSGKFQ